MSNLRFIYSLVHDEDILIEVKKKSDIGFWEYQFFGLLSYYFKKEKDILLITNNRLIYAINNELIKNIEYSNFSKIKFNSSSDMLSFFDKKNNNIKLSLKKMRLSFEEIQYLKNKLK